MPDWSHPATWGLAAASLGLLLAAAKAHGRQVRLEREASGIHAEDFRALLNDSRVAALWRRDRIRVWSVAPFVYAASALLVGLRDPDGGLFLLAGVWAVAGGLTFAGGWAYGGSAARISREARRGSAGWWAIVAAAWLLVAGLGALATAT